METGHHWGRIHLEITLEGESVNACVAAHGVCNELHAVTPNRITLPRGGKLRRVVLQPLPTPIYGL